MMTCQAMVTGPTGRSMPVRVLLDSGADLSSVSIQLAKHLHLKTLEPAVSVDTFDSTEEKIYHQAEFTLHSLTRSDWKLHMAALIVKRIIGSQPRKDASAVRAMEVVQGCTLADPDFDKPGRIDVLLGADILPYVQVHDGPESSIITVKTVFGDALMGTYSSEVSPQPLKGTIQVASGTSSPLPIPSPEDQLNSTIARFWELEEPSHLPPPFEMRVQNEYSLTHVYYIPSAGKYQVALPRKLNPLQLGESKNTALRRYYSNERALLRKGHWQKFQQVVQEYLDLVHARPVTAAELLLPPSEVFYLPMHMVHKSTSSTTKLRVVFDGSSQSTSGVSLNDTLAVGPMLHPTLDQILIKFRTYRVALTGDISKMYREILLAPSDQNYHRFLWRPKVDQAVQVFCMNRVTFGVSSSPYLAVQTLQQAGKDYGQEFPVAQHHIDHSFYVDDLLGGSDSVEGAAELFTQLTSILTKAGFTLRKFRSSSTQLLSQLPEELVEPLPNKELVDCHTASYPKALSIVWDSTQDTVSTSQASLSLPRGAFYQMSLRHLMCLAGLLL